MVLKVTPMLELQKNYNAADVENKWYQHWLEKKMFQADPAKGGLAYTILMPPPNVTGILHMGHALNVTIQDILIRWRRMEGRNVLWIRNGSCRHCHPERR